MIFSEPKAVIGFAGRRVIEQTLQEQLPDDFQTSEYLLHHGLLDLIVPRSFLKQALSETINFYKDAPFKQSGYIPHGVQPPLSFVSEEKIRRKWNTWNTQKGETQETQLAAVQTNESSYRSILTSFQSMFQFLDKQSLENEINLESISLQQDTNLLEQSLDLAKTEKVQRPGRREAYGNIPSSI